MKHLFYCLPALIIALSNTNAATISQNFEGITAPDLPSGWALIGSGGVTAANGNPGNSFDPASGSTNYLVNSGTGFSANSDFSGSFDFIIRENNNYDNISFFVGGVRTGLTTTAGDHFRVDLKRATFGRRASIYEATGNTDSDKLFNGDGNNVYAISTSTQYSAEFAWTAATGTFSIEWGTTSGSPDKGPMTFTGYSFSEEEVFFGFGTIDATGSFDNISITGTEYVEAIPEPSSILLGFIGTMLLLRRRR